MPPRPLPRPSLPCLHTSTPPAAHQAGNLCEIDEATTAAAAATAAGIKATAAAAPTPAQPTPKTYTEALQEFLLFRNIPELQALLQPSAVFEDHWRHQLVQLLATSELLLKGDLPAGQQQKSEEKATMEAATQACYGLLVAAEFFERGPICASMPVQQCDSAGWRLAPAGCLKPAAKEKSQKRCINCNRRSRCSSSSRV